MPAQAQVIDTAEFLEKLAEKQQLTVVTRDGAQVVLNLTSPAAMISAAFDTDLRQGAAPQPPSTTQPR